MLAIVLLAAPGRAGLAAHVYVLVLAAIGLGHLLAALRNALPPRRPSPFDAALRTRVASRDSGSPSSSGWSARWRSASRPPSTSTTGCGRRLRRIATELLAARRGIDLDASPDAARRALGDDAWEIVRGDREPPRERFAAGLDIASLRLAVTALEDL